MIYRRMALAVVMALFIAALPIHAQEALIFPEPTGEHQVGVVSHLLEDGNREEIFTEEEGDQREVLITVYYPAEPAADAETAPYLDDTMQEILGVPPELADSIQTHVYADAPIVDDRFPVLIFSPGMGALPQDYSSLHIEAASHGYVVAAIWHPYSTGITVFPDGRLVPASEAGYVALETSPEAEAQVGAVWAGDMIYVLDQLEQFNEDDALLAGHLDLERVGVFGHSFGGGAATEASYLDSRFQAGINMDGPLFGNVVEESVSQPFMVMFSDEWDLSIDEGSLAALGLTREEYEAQITDYINTYTAQAQASVDNAEVGYSARILGSTHFTFATDSGMLLAVFPELLPPTAVGSLAGERALEVISAYVVGFFDHHLKGEDVPLLDGESADYPEVELEVTN